MTLLSFVVVLGVVIFVHELGHFLAAKAVGVRVERFSMGFPPRLWGRKVGDTDYCISAIPFGGYVKMTGMIDESMDGTPLSGAPHEFMSKNTAQKVLVITAGVIMNFLLASGIYTGITLSEGIPFVQAPVVEMISAGQPAERAGIQQGDRIVAIDGRGIETWEAMVEVIHGSAGRPLQVEWERGGERLSATVTPEEMEVPVDGEIKKVGLIGISPRYEYRPAGFFEAIGHGFLLTGSNAMLFAKAVWRSLTSFSVREFGGPIAIAKMAGQSAKAGATAFLLFLAMINVSIGLLNILPFPVLDGGHLVIILAEGISRRPLAVKAKLAIQQVGMVLLLALMVKVIWQDLGRVGAFDRIRQMF